MFPFHYFRGGKKERRSMGEHLKKNVPRRSVEWRNGALQALFENCSHCNKMADGNEP